MNQGDQGQELSAVVPGDQAGAFKSQFGFAVADGQLDLPAAIVAQDDPLLHTVGAKSGQERINPVVYVKDGDRLVIIASKGGAPTHPDWYYNLLANPLVTVEVGTKQFQAREAISSEPERTRLYNQMVAMMPVFAGYQRKTTRVIPVITLTRVG